MANNVTLAVGNPPIHRFKLCRTRNGVTEERELRLREMPTRFKEFKDAVRDSFLGQGVEPLARDFHMKTKITDGEDPTPVRKDLYRFMFWEERPHPFVLGYTVPVIHIIEGKN